MYSISIGHCCSKGKHQNLVIYVGILPSMVCGLASVYTPLLTGEEITAELERRNLEGLIRI